MTPKGPKTDYRAVVAQRRDALRATCETILNGHSAFVWEVGSGHGHFLTAYAAAHPDRICIGVDVANDRVARAEKKRNRAKLPNLHFLHADALDFLAALPESAKFRAVFVLFPDPWPKRRHHKNRLMQSDFLKAVADRAGEGAMLYLRTDYEPYFSSAQDAIHGAPAWRISEEPWPFELATVFQQRAPLYHSLVAVRKGSGAKR